MGFAHSHAAFTHIFGLAGIASQFLYRKPKNVIYSRDVKRNKRTKQLTLKEK
jgi:hypothetical protein